MQEIKINSNSICWDCKQFLLRSDNPSIHLIKGEKSGNYYFICHWCYKYTND